jgi:hypothetical protein
LSKRHNSTVNGGPESRSRRQGVWPIVGLVIGILVGIIPSENGISPSVGVATWCMTAVLVLFLAASPVGARVGVLLAGLSLAAPCFLYAPPLPRAMLMCLTFLPFVAATALVLVSPIAGLRARLAYLVAWSSTRQVKRRAPGLDVASLIQLLVAAAVFSGALASVKTIPGSGLWCLARWFAGGILMLAIGEMLTAGLPLIATALGLCLPQLMRSPYRSASVSEFWAKRWNIFTSHRVLRPYFFAPLARHSVTLALWAVFLASGVVHALLVLMATGRWGVSLCFGAFFVVQPVLIAAERWLGVRRWWRPAGWSWTVAVLTITSPLFVEPMLQIVEESWGAPDNVLMPTVVVLGFVIALCAIVSLASLAVRPEEHNDKAALHHSRSAAW